MQVRFLPGAFACVSILYMDEELREGGHMTKKKNQKKNNSQQNTNINETNNQSAAEVKAAETVENIEDKKDNYKANTTFQ